MLNLKVSITDDQGTLLDQFDANEAGLDAWDENSDEEIVSEVTMMIRSELRAQRLRAQKRREEMIQETIASTNHKVACTHLNRKPGGRTCADCGKPVV